MRQAQLAAQLYKTLRRQHSSTLLRDLELQCRGACTCSLSSRSSTSPNISSWQPPLRPQPQQQQRGPRLGQCAGAAALLHHHHYATRSPQDESLIQDEAEIRELGSPRVKRIVEEIVNLNLLEVADLVEILRVRLGLGPESFGMQMQAAPGPPQAAGPSADAAAAAPVAEKTEFNVKLDGFDAAAKIKVIKEVRAITGLGLKEAKDMVEKAPVMLKEDLKKEEADAMKTKLEAAGAKISLE